MPYAKKKKPQRFKKGTGSTKSFIKKEVKKSIRRMRPQELHMLSGSSVTAITAAQVIGNTVGFHVQDVTSNVYQLASSANSAGRVGLNITCKGILTECFLQQQSACNVRVRGRVELWWTDDTASTTTAFLQTVYRGNSISGIVDYNSAIAPEVKTTSKRLMYKKFSIDPDQYSGQTTVYRNIKMFVKMRRQLQYGSSSSSVPINGRFIYAILFDGGNASTVTASTLNVPLLAVSTGYFGYTAFTGWHVDDC